MTRGARWAHVLERHPGVRALLLLGSRARGTHRTTSDWDLGYLGIADLLTLRADVVDVLRTDDVDLVPLDTASAVLRRDAADHAQVLTQRSADAFACFQVEAATYWCDVEPVVREAHADVLRAVTA